MIYLEFFSYSFTLCFVFILNFLFFPAYFPVLLMIMGFPCGSAGKESACNAEDLGSIPGLGRSPGEGKGFPLQYSCLENSVDSPWGHKESGTTEWLSLSLMTIIRHSICQVLMICQEATVRSGHGTTNWFQIGKGVCQGCILSPCLFNLYAENIMRNAGLEEAQAGIKIAGSNINNLR